MLRRVRRDRKRGRSGEVKEDGERERENRRAFAGYYMALAAAKLGETYESGIGFEHRARQTRQAPRTENESGAGFFLAKTLRAANLPPPPPFLPPVPLRRV